MKKYNEFISESNVPKMVVKPMMAYNTYDVLQFMYYQKYGKKYGETEDSKDDIKFWNKCNEKFGHELLSIAYKKPEQIQIEDSSERIFKIVVSKLVEPCSILDFTKYFDITEDYLLLFTD